MVRRFEIFLLNMDPGPEARDTRPCVVISPDEINLNLDSVIIAPVSTVTRKYPTRVMFDLLGSERAIVLDQMLTVERTRLAKKIGELDGDARSRVVEVLAEMFAR